MLGLRLLTHSELRVAQPDEMRTIFSKQSVQCSVELDVGVVSIKVQIGFASRHGSIVHIT